MGKDIIRIKGLKIYAYHGVFPEEKELGQFFVIDCEITTDFIKAARKDDLNYSIHYGEVCLFIEKEFTRTKYDLIETAAVNTAEALLNNFYGIKSLILEVKKPEAPIPMEFHSVSVQVERQWHQVYCSFGSNMGERKKYVTEALEQLKDDRRFRNLKASSFYESKAYGGIEQEDFLNGAFYIETFLSPYELLEVIHEIEAKAGRKRELRWGPRTLDLDILLYDQLILDEEELQIPHKDMANRDFVLIPLKEIASYVRHPLNKKTVEEMAEELSQNYLL
ncbi:MAG: 2-amino-4-hydroxy-6-hydroxymethyldihydropteridine diphosphokinase [Lachnospiraceae bacterium]|nr:2-amino-4-hydroxy-6-hydroxymethyldihydropteridine diphosphokinase [Lachnospiraceae bacterium]